MGNIFNSYNRAWANTPELEALIAKAVAYGADDWILQGEFRTRTFLSEKERLQDKPLNPDLLLRSALRISFEKKKGNKKRNLIGNAVAISRTFALTALHGNVTEGHRIILHTCSGVKLEGTVALVVFEKELVDIALIELKNGQEFPCFTSVSLQRVSLLDAVYIAGLKLNSRDDANVAVFEAKVNVIEKGENNALFQSSYVSFDSLSGAGVVAKKEGSEFKVIGVHVASHDDTTETAPVEKAAQTEDCVGFESVSVALASLSSSIHGHSAYTMICEIARVPSLVSFMRERGLHN